MNIDWLGHDTTRITTGDLVIYIDPYQIKGNIPADIILVSHEHYDHCSLEDIKKIQKNDTVVVCSSGCEIEGNVEKMKAGDSKTVKGIKIETLPAYNTNKPNHPKSAGGLGFVITVEGKRIYHAGDADIIPEMSDVDCNIALLPVSGTYVMDANEAAEAAKTIKPDVAIPVHYGAGVVGTIEDAKQFAEALKGTDIKVEIKEKTI